MSLILLTNQLTLSIKICQWQNCFIIKQAKPKQKH